MSGAATAAPLPSDAGAPGLWATPEGALSAFAEAIGRGEVAAAAACLCRDARLITPDSTTLSGREAIRPILTQLVAMRVRVRVEALRVVVAGDVALGRGRWRGLSAEPDGGGYEQSWHSTVVLRRVESDWKLHILAPWEIEREKERPRAK